MLYWYHLRLSAFELQLFAHSGQRNEAECIHSCLGYLGVPFYLASSVLFSHAHRVLSKYQQLDLYWLIYLGTAHLQQLPRA